MSQLKHEVFVFKAAAKQLGLLLMLRNKEIEGKTTEYPNRHTHTVPMKLEGSTSQVPVLLS